MAYTITGNELVFANGFDNKGNPSPANIPLPLSQIGAYAAGLNPPTTTVGITAGTTRTQGGATALPSSLNRVDTSTAPAGGSLLGDGVILPASGNARITLINNTANPIQVYAQGSDTVNGVAGATGIAIPPNAADIFWSASSGSWQVEAGVGYAGQLNTVLSLDSIAAAGTTQGTGTALVADFNRITTATAGSAFGVVLPAGKAGLDIFIVNDSGVTLQVYGNNASDTIDGVAYNTGVSQMTGSLVLYTYHASGAWRTEGLATGYAGSLQTFFPKDAIAAAGTTQGTATVLTAMQNRVTTATNGSAQGVVLPAAVAGMNIEVMNAAAAWINVYPAGADQINANGASAPYVLPPNSVVGFFTTVAGIWHTVSAQNVPQPFQYQTNAATTATTLTAANIAGAQNIATPIEIDLNMTGALAAGANATLPTVASLVAQIPNAIAGQTYKLRVINSSSGAFAWTVVTNTGWTLNGTMTVNQNTWRDFVVTLTSLAAATLQSVGTGTFS